MTEAPPSAPQRPPAAYTALIRTLPGTLPWPTHRQRLRASASVGALSLGAADPAAYSKRLGVDVARAAKAALMMAVRKRMAERADAALAAVQAVAQAATPTTIVLDPGPSAPA